MRSPEIVITALQVISTIQFSIFADKQCRYSDNNLVAETNHIYDDRDRLTNITHSNSANIIASYSQTYDQGDRITSVTSNDGNSSYTYDSTNQLVSGEYDFQDNENYSYDSNGNRTNNGYVTGVNNQLLEDNKYLYEYDIVGNRTKRTDKSTNEVMEYRWDIRDRLTGITVKNDLGEIIRTAEYTYDVYNQRIAKTVDTDGDGVAVATTERYVYGRDQNIGLVFDENGNVNHRYLFSNGVDQIEADESNGNVLWALTDHLGSVRDVVDDSGTVLNHIVYDAFGGVTSQTDESVVFRYGYTAREFDAESGLQYNRARYLDSFTGKFISEDPISFEGGDFNLYRYVFNSPLNGTDPSGLQTASDEFPIFRIPPIPIPDLGQTLQDIGNGISEAGKAVERFLVPPAEAPNFPSNPQASKNRKPAPTPSPSPNPTPIPFCPMDDKKREHRGRIQAQGGKPKIEKKENWAQLYPLSKIEGINLLVMLEGQLTPTEKKDRAIPLQKARDWINAAASKGGVSAYVQKSFLKKGSDDVRIDIEVNKGDAFVP